MFKTGTTFFDHNNCAKKSGVMILILHHIVSLKKLTNYAKNQGRNNLRW